MIHLLCEPLPDSVTADGKAYPVRTDFRIWLKFADMLQNQNSVQNPAFILRSVLVRPAPVFTETFIDAVYRFYRAEALNYQEEDEISDKNQATPETRKSLLFDWKFDAKFVLGDFRHYYQMDLISLDFLHWFEFCALFDAMPEEARCMKRIAYRSADLNQIKDKNEKKRIRRLKRAVAVPHVMTDEEIAAGFANF